MRYLMMGTAGLGLLALSASIGLNPASATGQTVSAAQAPILLAQNETKKSETMTQKVKREVKEDTASAKKSVKRAWKKLTGYKFNVACPILLPLTHTTCTETGKNRADAQAKCQEQNPLCSVTAAK